MQTTINQNHRIFVVTDSTGNSFSGNFEHLESIVKEYQLQEGYFKIFEYWNGKPKKITRAALKRMYKADNKETPFYY